MVITKRRFLDMIKGLPSKIDVEDLMYRLYLQEKLAAAEEDIRQGRVLSHDAVVKETAKWFMP